MTGPAGAIGQAMGPFRIRRIAFAVFSLMVIGALATLALTPRVHIADSRNYDLERLIPKSFGGWTMDEVHNLILPDPGSQRLVNKIYNTVLARSYRNALGDEVMLVIAYGGDQSDALQLHRPEVCYEAAGFQVRRPYYNNLRLAGHAIHMARVETQRTNFYEPVSYWMRVGERQVTTNMDRQWAKFVAGTHGVIPDGVLVRVSTRGPHPDLVHAYKIQDRFVADLLTNIDGATRQLLIGKERVAEPRAARGGL